MTSFCRFELRTTDAVAARAFYAALLGHERAVIVPLHEQALARGARAHWLGHLGVDDVERTAAALEARGATRLGPTRRLVDGTEAVVLRDPGGAVLALGAPLPANAATQVDVALHVLNTIDAPRAAARYRELFGWELTDRVDDAVHGTFQRFAWQAGGAIAGAIGDVAGRPGVHPHWLFYFAVDALETARTCTLAAGGIVLEPFVLPSGARACVCDDAQGAAFGLLERPRR